MRRPWRRCGWNLQELGWIHSVRSWFEIHEHLHSVGVAFLYIQVACALVGCLGNVYTGVPVADLTISLFALVAVESGSQLLLRIYAVLLASSLITGTFWFVLVAAELRDTSQQHKSYLRTLLFFQATSYSFRVLSIVVWIRVYRQGAAAASTDQAVDFASRIRNFGEVPELSTFWTQEEQSEAVVGGSIYDPVYYSSLFGKAPEAEQLILKPHFEAS